MSIFDQVSQAQVQGRGTKINETARFLVEIQDVHLQKSNQGLGMLFVAEFSILEGTVDNPAGAVRSWVQRPETRSQTDLGNIKAFIAACHGLSSGDSLDPTLGDAMVSGANPAKGTRLCLETEKITTRGGFDYTVHQWGTAPTVAAAAAAPTVAAAAPPPPPAPVAELTEARWLAGEGTGAPHPTAPGWEYCPDHRTWACRQVG